MRLTAAQTERLAEILGYAESNTVTLSQEDAYEPVLVTCYRYDGRTLTVRVNSSGMTVERDH